MPFPTTRWDELAQASLHGDTVARGALDEFCRRYWAPVNGFIRWKGHPEAEAADLTQDFFLNFLETRSWRRADPLRGRFRTFLLGALAHRLAKARAREQRLKRGGGAAVLSLDDASSIDGATQPAVLPAEVSYFDRAWALRVLEVALAATRDDYAAKGKARLFDALNGFLTPGATPPSYDAAAADLGLGLGTLKTEIHRLRQALREALHLEISRTVSAPHEIGEELRHLRAVLATQSTDPSPPRETQGGGRGTTN